MSCQVPSFQKDQKKCCVHRPDRDSHTVIPEFSQAINFRIVRKFLEVMKLYSLLRIKVCCERLPGFGN